MGSVGPVPAGLRRGLAIHLASPGVSSEVDYDSQFPPEYKAGHTECLRLLRVLHRTRSEHDREAEGTLTRR